MTLDRIFATLAGPAFVALIILFFRLGIRKGLRDRQAALPDVCRRRKRQLLEGVNR